MCYNILAMLRAFRHVQDSILAVIFLGVWIGNVFLWQNAIIGVTLLAFALLIFGSLVGAHVNPEERPAIRTGTGIWMLLSAVMLIGCAAYYFARIAPIVIHAVILLIPPIALWLAHRKHARGWFDRPHNKTEEHHHRVAPAVWVSASVVLLCVAVVLQLLQHSQTVEALRTPWDAVSGSIFLAMFAALALLFALLQHGRERAISFPLVSAALFAFLSVATLVFPLGYGFDPFIHRATESHLAFEGTITPKPFYYIGQYVLVLFLHHGFAIPVDLADAWLVPILAAVLLPIAWYTAAAHLVPNRRAAAATLAGLFLLPLASFITTTPQGLANLWTVLLILGAVPFLARVERPRVWPLALPALAGLSVHPIAGIPAVLFLALLASEPRRANARLKPYASALYWTIAALGCVVLPVSFLANALLSGMNLSLDLSTLSPSSIFSALHLDLFFENRFNPLLDFVYLFGFNAVAFVIAISAYGWWSARKTVSPALRAYVLLAVMLTVNFILLSTAITFSFLIDYERQDYAGRLIPLAIFFLIPLFILGLGRAAQRLHAAPVVLRVSAVVLLAALATSAFYLTYPRRDSYETSHGFNVSQADINSVHAIETDAAGASHIVLANQSVSAAAIHEIGFTHYFGAFFFYPIPTGGELYDLFLSMNVAPARQTTIDAATLMNDACAVDPACDEKPVEIVYYVVNDYWWQADRLVETGKQTADRWFAIDDGKVYVFRYDLTPSDADTTP